MRNQKVYDKFHRTVCPEKRRRRYEMVNQSRRLPKEQRGGDTPARKVHPWKARKGFSAGFRAETTPGQKRCLQDKANGKYWNIGQGK